MWYSWNEILENDQTLSSYIRLSGVQVVWLISTVDFWLCSGIEVEQDTFPACIQDGCAIGEKLSLWNQGHEFTTLWTHLLCCIQGLWVTPLITGNFPAHMLLVTREHHVMLRGQMKASPYAWLGEPLQVHVHCRMRHPGVLLFYVPCSHVLHTFFHPSQQSNNGILQV